MISETAPLHHDIAAMSFERGLKELETIVSRLERGDVELEESIAIYERGEALKSHCDKLLRQAEAKVEKLTFGPDGRPKGTTPFDGE
jgi:exodeoxyribonuclease VII small subunit